MFEVSTEIVVKYADLTFRSEKDAKTYAIRKLINDSGVEIPGPAAEKLSEYIFDKADAAVAILTWHAEGCGEQKAKLPTDAEFDEAAKNSGFPIKVLKSRVTALGWSLAKASTEPYTPRPRKLKTAAQSAPAPAPATVPAPPDLPF